MQVVRKIESRPTPRFLVYMPNKVLGEDKELKKKKSSVLYNIKFENLMGHLIKDIH